LADIEDHKRPYFEVYQFGAGLDTSIKQHCDFEVEEFVCTGLYQSIKQYFINRF
jgi:hypothetical protein